MSQPSMFADDDPTVTWSVAELNEAVQQVLRRAFRDEVAVRGEIRGLNRSGAGHVYFNLVERIDGVEHRLKVTLFASAARSVESYLRRYRMRLEDGIAVRIQGQLDFYAPNGSVSVRMTGIDPTYTLGTLAADRDALIRRLVELRVPERNRRRSMPACPLRVGLVTSRAGAAYADITRELAGSGFAFEVTLCDTRVQGDGAARSVALALVTMAELARAGHLDVVALVRGGGDRTDLAVFDDEGIALAIATVPVPVLTGIGHETDTTVADVVAHSPLKTPTAVGARLVDQVRSHRDACEATWSAIGARATTTLLRHGARLDHAERRAARAGEVAVRHAHDRCEAAQVRLRREVMMAVAAADQRLAVMSARLRSVDPAVALARGWSITRRADGTLVRSPDQLTSGDELVTIVADGVVTSVVR